jgi:DNA-binding NarL/FixJ family response regulator
MDHDPYELSTDGRAPVGHRVPPTWNPRSEAEPRASPFRVLLAHRHGIFSQGLAALLAAEPDVEFLAQVADGEAAWEAIRTQEPDVVLLELALVKPSGIEVARRVHVAALTTRCLTLATHPDPRLASQALGVGAGCILTDSGFEELMCALRRIDAGGTYLSPSIAPGPRPSLGPGHDATPLTSREREVVRLVATGQSSKMIARTLGISPQTVDTHRRRILKKLDLHSSAEVVRYALRSGLMA